MSLVKTGSIKKSKAWKGIFQDKKTPTIEQSKSKKIPSTEKCMHRVLFVNPCNVGKKKWYFVTKIVLTYEKKLL